MFGDRAADEGERVRTLSHIVSMGSGFLRSWFGSEPKSGAERFRSGVSVARVEEPMWDYPWYTRIDSNASRGGGRYTVCQSGVACL